MGRRPSHRLRPSQVLRFLDSGRPQKLYLSQFFTREGFGAMARKKVARRDWRMTLFLVVSLIIVLSMVLTMFLVSAPTAP